ncbi:MAG: DUF2628 domain-containing protein [Aureispira sp.]|nr:DUF2628 domain-containing protein [Aureispira sp.]
MAILDNNSTVDRAKEEADWRLFLGTTSSMYIPAWKSFRDGGSKISFNVLALFFNIFWLFSKKMYRFLLQWVVFMLIAIPILVLLGLAVDLYILEDFFAWFIPLSVVALFLGSILFVGFMGNWFYYTQATRIIAKTRQEFSNDEEGYKEKLTNSRGVKIKGKVILLVIMIILIYQFIALLDSLNWK